MKLPKLFAFRGSPKFTTDGCSGYMTWLWLKVFGHVPPWNGVCVMHDAFYYFGGGKMMIAGKVWPQWSIPFTRRDADAYLFREIKRRGFTSWAWLCWLGTRAGGSQYLPFSWRWRYRENYFAVLVSSRAGYVALQTALTAAFVAGLFLINRYLP